MAHYMSQDLFTTLALKLASMRRLNAGDRARQDLVINDALQGYRRFYTRDPFERELWHAVDAIDQWLVGAYPSQPEQMAWMHLLRGALMNYTSDGKRKRSPLFRGLWYTSARAPPPDRSQQCMRDLASCYQSLQLGRIPL